VVLQSFFALSLEKLLWSILVIVEHDRRHSFKHKGIDAQMLLNGLWTLLVTQQLVLGLHHIIWSLKQTLVLRKAIAVPTYHSHRLLPKAFLVDFL